MGLGMSAFGGKADVNQRLLKRPLIAIAELLVLVVALLWSLEIRRGNQTEDYIFENYENPLKE